MKQVSQNLKDGLLVAASVLLGLLAVSGDGLADYANSSFSQVFWAVANIIGFVGFAGGWLYLKAKDNGRAK